MRGIKHLVSFCVSISAISAAKIHIGKLTTLCSRSDSNLNSCATRSANELLPQMVKGIRDYAFPSIDPLMVPFMRLSQSERAVGLKLNISNSNHEGMSNATFQSVRLNLKQNKIEADLSIPKYNIIGTCDIGGRILLLPIVGHGKCNLTSYDQKVTIKMKLKTEEKSNNNSSKAYHYKVDKFVVHVTFSKGSFNLEGLFGGNKELGKAMNRFLNNNAVDVLNEMKPTLESVWGQLYRDLTQRILASVPIDQMFLS